MYIVYFAYRKNEVKWIIALKALLSVRNEKKSVRHILYNLIVLHTAQYTNSANQFFEQLTKLMRFISRSNSYIVRFRKSSHFYCITLLSNERGESCGKGFSKPFPCSFIEARKNFMTKEHHKKPNKKLLKTQHSCDRTIVPCRSDRQNVPLLIIWRPK